MYVPTRIIPAIGAVLVNYFPPTLGLQLYGYDPEPQVPDKCSEFADVVEMGTLGPELFLIMTAPISNKVVWTEAVFARTWRVLEGKVNALIDNVAAPSGIAWDRDAGKLYVSSVETKDIKQYKIRIDVSREHKRKTMKVEGDPLLIASGIQAKWISVDSVGNLYFTDLEDNTVNKIKREIIQKIELRLVSATDLMKQSALAAAQATESPTTTPEKVEDYFTHTNPTPPPMPTPVIVELAVGDPYVYKPAGIAANTEEVYWGNGGNMTTGGLTGTDCQKSEAYKIITNPGNIFGVEITANSVFYAYNNTIVKKPMNTDLTKGVDTVGVTMVDQLSQPRGLAYDGEGTLFVALYGGNSVVSIPTGANQPTTADMVVSVDGVQDITVVSCKDEGLDIAWEAQRGTSAMGSLMDITMSEIGGLMNVEAGR